MRRRRKRVKGQAGRESGTLRSASEITLRSASEIANMASLFDFGAFLSEWGLPKAVAKALGEERFCSKVALLGLTEEDIGCFEQKKGEMAALRTAVGQMQAEGGRGPLAPKTATPAPSRRPSVLLVHDLLTTNADGVDIGARATARVDLDPQFYLHKASGEAKPHLITYFVSDTVTDTEEISLGPGATLKLTSGTKPKLHAVSPAMWIAANARIMAALYDSGDLDHGAAKDYMAYTAKIGELALRYTWASVLAYDQEYRRRQAAARFRWGSDSQHLCTVLLKEKVATPAGIKPCGGQTGRRVGPGGKEVCIQYNHGKCSYGPRCNFEHVCLLCLQAHPQSDHRQQQATAKQE